MLTMHRRRSRVLETLDGQSKERTPLHSVIFPDDYILFFYLFGATSVQITPTHPPHQSGDSSLPSTLSSRLLSTKDCSEDGGLFILYI